MRSHPAHSFSGRNAQLARLLGVLRDLDRLGGVSIYELAERYGTTARTIRRDLDALRDVGLPLEEDGGGESSPSKRWKLGWSRQREKLAGLLDVSHYLALRMAMGREGPPSRTSSLFAALEDLADKVGRMLGPGERERLLAIERSFLSWERRVYRQSAPDIFWPLVEAVSGGRVCRVRYRLPSPKPCEKTLAVLPLRLFTHDAAAYVVGTFPGLKDALVLNLQRVVSLKVLDKVAVPPEGLDLDRFERSAFGVVAGGRPTTYRLRFDDVAAPYIRERVWHPSQTLKDVAAGGVELVFTCGESFEVPAWVASWKEHVEVVAPVALRKELLELGMWLRDAYSVGHRGAPKPQSPRPRGA